MAVCDLVSGAHYLISLQCSFELSWSSSETQGQLVGANKVNQAEIVAMKVFNKSRKSPWETNRSRLFPNGSVNAGS